MRLYIEDQRKTVTVRIYGIYGNEITREYLLTFFGKARELRELSDEDRAGLNTDAEMSIASYDVFKVLAQYIGTIQDSIDAVADAMVSTNSVDEYIIDNALYAI
ncbi:MAG: hypothetical protein IJ583_11460 [Firmicutes bacterium]|nr:hypothetical protein [Bacillota bacterium]